MAHPADSQAPDTMQLRKEIVTTLVKSSSVFISYLGTSSRAHAELMRSRGLARCGNHTRQ